MLERFDWGAPDRLELAGTFAGLAAEAIAEPVLAVHGGDGVHRLPAVEHDGADGPDGDGLWTAAFVWLEAPVAFHAAELELGDGLTVALPEPGSAVDGTAIPVRPAYAGDDADADGDTPLDVEGAVHRLSQEAQKLERALAATAGERARAEQHAQAEAAALRERVAELEQAAGDLTEARAERDEALRALEAARDEVDALQRALEDARSGAKELLERMSRIADPTAEGR